MRGVSSLSVSSSPRDPAAWESIFLGGGVIVLAAVVVERKSCWVEVG